MKSIIPFTAFVCVYLFVCFSLNPSIYWYVCFVKSTMQCADAVRICLPYCLFVCLFASLHVCLFLHLFLCRGVCLCAWISPLLLYYAFLSCSSALSCIHASLFLNSSLSMSVTLSLFVFLSLLLNPIPPSFPLPPSPEVRKWAMRSWLSACYTTLHSCVMFNVQLSVFNSRWLFFLSLS